MANGNKTVKKKVSRRQINEWMAAFLFIAPLLIGIGVFYIFPFLQNFWFSLNEVNKFNMTTFVGFNNYKQMFTDKEVWLALLHTFQYAVITVPVGLILSLFLAALLNTKIKGTSIYRTIYFLPSVTMSAAVAIVWKWIFNEKFGILNAIMKFLHLPTHGWLNDPNTALFMIMIVGIWCSVGYNMIILLAGMQGISKFYYEAAKVDGAGFFKQFFKITLPMLTPTIFFVLITSIIGAFQVFDTIYLMIGKSNLSYKSTQTLVMIFYRQAFDYGHKGYAASIAVFIFAIIMLLTAIQMIVQKKWVNYD